MAPSMVSIRTLGLNAYHHHLGVLPSATPATASEIHPIGRRFDTSGSRASSGGGGCSFSEEAMPASAISPLLSRRIQVYPTRGLRRGRRQDRLHDVQTDFRFAP